MIEFEAFGKIARLKREMIVTEKLDGTNACVGIFPTYEGDLDPYVIAEKDGFVMYAGSRTRWIMPEGTPGMNKGCDNFSFAQFVRNNSADLFKLGEGRHFGEWYGLGIQRNYGLTERRYALFNTGRWNSGTKPDCCEVVPVLESDPDEAMAWLKVHGSAAVPGFMNPEGVVVFHSASRQLYKYTFDNDGGKWSV